MIHLARKLYMIPCTLGDSDLNRTIPAYNLEIIQHLSHYIVEEEKTARRFLIRCGYKNDLNSVKFYTLNEHTHYSEIPFFFRDSEQADLGLLSEAGVPGVADPGAIVVKEAHKLKIRVVPLTGPSSLILALMASGMNGQQFAFNGYLPVKPNERASRIKSLEKRSESEHQSQLFIEAPYRNLQMMDALLSNLKADTRLCVAVNLTLPDEWIRTDTVKNWKASALPDIRKKPAVFIIEG